MATTVTKRCTVCARFRAYEIDDRHCVICGHESLEGECSCGRRYDYLRDDDDEATGLHCPRCGRVLRGRQKEYDA